MTSSTTLIPSVADPACIEKNLCDQNHDLNENSWHLFKLKYVCIVFSCHPFCQVSIGLGLKFLLNKA